MGYTVKFRLPELQLGRADITFDVTNDSGKLGTLELSKGGFVWYDKNCTYGHKLDWEEFAALVQKFPEVEKRKK